jgi:hypothetical protein
VTAASTNVRPGCTSPAAAPATPPCSPRRPLARDNGGVQEAFGIVIVVVVVIGAIVAVITVAGSGRAYDDIGRGGMSAEPSVQAEVGAREAEIRQMLEARSARRVRRGGEPLDAELAALTRGAPDPGIAVEVRQLVEARNARRVRQGKEPLDVEAEVARRLRELAD